MQWPLTLWSPPVCKPWFSPASGACQRQGFPQKDVPDSQVRSRVGRMNERPHFDVAVVMRRERINNRWQPWRWSLADVVPHEPAFGTAPRTLLQGPDEERWLFPGFSVELFRDDAEGYQLNLESPAPCWFVLWRMDEDTGTNTPLARPLAVSLSYHEAGRWLDAQETVEQVPAPPEVLDSLRTFAQAHYTPETRRRKRPDSFRSLQDRFGNPASVSTEKLRGGGPHG